MIIITYYITLYNIISIIIQVVVYMLDMLDVCVHVGKSDTTLWFNSTHRCSLELPVYTYYSLFSREL